jgi:N-acetylneuraminic acid mutarotase
MRYSLHAGKLALSTLVLAACVEETTTEPKQAESTPGAPELAIASNSWLTRANMPANRTNLATATITNAAGQSVVYAIGGLNPYGNPVTTVTAYNVATNTWTFRHTLPVPLAGSNGAGVINGKIYVSGGYSRDVTFPGRALYMYNPATNTWTRKRDIPIVNIAGGDPYVDRKYAAGNGVTGVINGKLYVVSGCFQSQDPWGYFETCSPLFFRYNPATDAWVRLPNPFASAYAHGPSIGGVIDNKFYVMAASGDTRGAQMAVYDPALNKWTPQTALGLARPGAASAVLGGKLYVIGGSRFNVSKDAWETLAITIRYDPTTGTWTRRADLPSPRQGIAASKVFVNGAARIEVLGGIGTSNNLQYVP